MIKFKKILIRIAEIALLVNLISGLGCIYYGYIDLITYVANGLMLSIAVYFMKKSLLQE